MKLIQYPARSSQFPEDRALNTRWRVSLMLAGLTVVAVARLLDAAPHAVDALYSEGLGPWIGLALARISGLVPFSIVEVAAAILLILIVLRAGLSLRHVVRRKRRLFNALACGFLHAGATAAILVTIFYAGWGFSFSRPKMMSRLGWQDMLDVKNNQELADELAHMCEGLIKAANNEYERAFNSKDIGKPTQLPVSIDKIDAAIEQGYQRLTTKLGLRPHFAIPRGRIKPVAASPLLSRMLIMGFYSPWTGEAHYNTQMPALNIPQVAAHEKAHQRCITSEDEANFFGVLACVLSDEPYVRYSGFLAAQRQMLNALYEMDPERAMQIADKRLPGIIRDRQAERDFIMRNLGVISNAGNAVNDAYLKANRVKEGVLSYDMDTQLLIAFTRAHGSAWYDNTYAQDEQPATPYPDAA